MVSECLLERHVPTGTTVEAWGHTMLQELVAVALRQPNWRIIGVMFALATVTMHDGTPTDVRALDELIPLQPER